MKVNKLQQQQLHPQQQLLLLPPFAVRRATNHNPVDTNSIDAWAAARSSTATRSANERIGVQVGTSKMQTIEKEERREEGQQQP